MSRVSVRRLYSVAGGRWWDPFRVVWEFCTSQQAIRDLESLFRRYVSAQTRVLDLGCGTGANLGRLIQLQLPFKQYTGVDFSPHMLALARKRFRDMANVTFMEGDATSLRHSDELYDVIAATWLLDHLNEPAAFVNDVQRLLVPGGHLLLLFYSRPRWFVRFWLAPLGRMLVRADPVAREEVSKFSGVLFKKTRAASAVTLIDIGAPGVVDPGAARQACYH